MTSSPPDAHSTSVDAVVVGAGPAGCATATVLADGGARVALIHDARKHAWPGESLPAGSTQVVEDVFGARILDGHHAAYAVQAAWETSELHITDALSQPRGEGWLLDRSRFDAQARASAVAAGAQLITGHGSAARTPDGTWRLTGDGFELTAPVLVDATGRSSVLARRAGAVLTQDARLLACVVTLPHGGDPAQATTIESVDAGWWYSTPTPAGGRVVALVTDADLVPRGAERMTWWLSSLRGTRHIRELLGADLNIDAAHWDLTVSQAGTGWLEAPCGPGWLAVGDAAAHFDPLSSQGLLTAILMGARAGRGLLDGELAEWALDYRMLVDDHRVLAAHYYGLVTQWPQSPFWIRRMRRM